MVYNRLLIPRVRVIALFFMRLVLQPHDSLDTSYYSMPSPETLSYLVYNGGMTVSCIEGLTVEGTIFTGVTNIKVPITYNYTYLVPPGVFGTVGSSISLTDSTGLRVFDRTTTGASIITQEDQCADEETDHTTGEIVFTLTIGVQTALPSCTICFAKFESSYLQPTSQPTIRPTAKPSPVPSRSPTRVPSSTPTLKPSAAPSRSPTLSPSRTPSRAPTLFPTQKPTLTPSTSPTNIPSSVPTVMPTLTPTFSPSVQPSSSPSLVPSVDPTFTPSSVPSTNPSFSPSSTPSVVPSVEPTFTPSSDPTFTPSSDPTFAPSEVPTLAPSSDPTLSPSSSPTIVPTVSPSTVPTPSPSVSPTFAPTFAPSVDPTFSPTSSPSVSPTLAPTQFCPSRTTTTDVQDLIAKTNVTSFWIEGGFADVDDRGWISISTTYTGFNNASVFVSLPNIPGQTSAEGYPAIARVQQVVPQGQVSFQTRLFQANDSFCSKQWRIPQYISTPLELSWLVVEHGAFLITDKYRVMVGRGAITREDSVVSNQNNFIRFNYPVGCVSSTDSCRFPDGSSPATILQLQTMVYNRLLIPRVRVIALFFLRLVLQPHDSVDPSYYPMLSPETVSYLIYQNGMNVSCVEGLSMEGSIFTGVTNVKVPITFGYTYLVPPGVFGVVGSSISLTDSTGLRVFDTTTTTASIILQEDQCLDEETDHTTGEIVFTLVIGAQTSVPSCVICFAIFSPNPPTMPPTFAPWVITHFPTFSPTGESLIVKYGFGVSFGDPGILSSDQAILVNFYRDMEGQLSPLSVVRNSSQVSSVSDPPLSTDSMLIKWRPVTLSGIGSWEDSSIIPGGRLLSWLVSFLKKEIVGFIIEDAMSSSYLVYFIEDTSSSPRRLSSPGDTSPIRSLSITGPGISISLNNTLTISTIRRYVPGVSDQQLYLLDSGLD